MPTVVQLRKMCKEKGIRGYSKWRKDELMKKCGVSTARKSSKRITKQPTMAQLRKMCKEKGIRGYSKWRKAELMKKCGVVSKKITVKLTDFDIELLGCTKDHMGKFIPIKRIGSGTMGTVFKVCDPGSCDYVVKVETSYGSDFKEALKSLKKEVKMGKMAASLGIGPKIWKYGSCDNKTYIIMQKMLKTLDDPSNYPYKKEHIVDALDKYYKLGKSGLWQFDLKSNNIMFDSKGRLYIIDYGIAKTSVNNLSEHMTDIGQLFLDTLVGRSVDEWGANANWIRDKNDKQKLDQLTLVYKTIHDWLTKNNLRTKKLREKVSRYDFSDQTYADKWWDEIHPKLVKNK